MSELVIERAMPEHGLEPVGDGWTVRGLVVPYGVEQTVSDDGGRTHYLEEWAGAAFARDVAKGGRWVNLYVGHHGDDGDRWLGRCVELDDAADGLWAAFRLQRDHARAEEARSGELRGWSVGARVYRTRTARRGGRTVLVRELAGLNHVAATRAPQYAGAGVAVAREHVLVGPADAPIRDALRARLDAVRVRG